MRYHTSNEATLVYISHIYPHQATYPKTEDDKQAKSFFLRLHHEGVVAMFTSAPSLPSPLVTRLYERSTSTSRSPWSASWSSTERAHGLAEIV